MQMYSCVKHATQHCDWYLVFTDLHYAESAAH